MGGHFELGRAADRLDCLLQRAIGKGRKSAALVANQVVVVQLGIDPLVTGRIAADLDPLHEVQPVELIQGPIDAGPTDRVQPPVDLQCRHRTRLAGKQLDHLAPRRAAAVSGLIEAPNCCLGPSHGRESYQIMRTVLNTTIS